MSYRVSSKMKKYEIRDYGSGIFEVVMSVWVWTYKPHLLEALREISDDYRVLSVIQAGMLIPHYAVTTMPK